MKVRKKHIKILDVTGIRCPEPVLKIAMTSVDMNEGDVLEVIGDCPTFEKDTKMWCKRLHKTLLLSRNYDNGKTKCQIQF